ncbi:MAG: hypothetical protein HYR84_15285 [Planctomycetes bacterium]|nr:hypothetical protein [Planctomycetota bacterium]
MFRRLLVPALSAIVLAFGTASIDAQTGPINKSPSPGNGNGPNGATNPNPAPAMLGAALTPERVASLLQAKGAKTETNVSEIGGNRITKITARIEKDDFRYSFDVVYVTPAKGIPMWFYTAALNTGANNLPMNKLQGLLKENNLMAGDCAFMITPQGVLQLNSRTYAGVITDQFFHNDVTRFMKDIRETSHLWLPSN